VRLQKFISNYSSISRRKAESFIKEGKVKVNGSIVTIPYFDVSENDTIIVNGKRIFVDKTNKYYVFYKPVNYLSSFYDQGDQKGLKEFFKERQNLKIAGRLDYYSEGLLLITNNTRLINILTHPSYQIEKEYLVFSYKPISQQLIKAFKKGVMIDSVFYKANDIILVKDTMARILLTEGKNREIRNVFAAFKQPISRLIRVRVGPLRIGNLKPAEKKEIPEYLIEPLLKLEKQKKIEPENNYKEEG
jgi:pseudouridine synthase